MEAIIGWIGVIIIGGIAGWIAEKIMKAEHNLLMNIIMGVVGALIANAILWVIFGGVPGNWIVQLIVAVIGACLLIWIVRAVRGRSTT